MTLFEKKPFPYRIVWNVYFADLLADLKYYNPDRIYNIIRFTSVIFEDAFL